MTFDIDEQQNYVKTLCERNTDLNHNVDGNKSFARLKSDEEVTELRNSAGKNIVVVAAIRVKRVGAKEDYSLQVEMVLRVVSYAENITPDETGAARKRAWVIVLDLVTEMERQQEYDMDHDVCGIMDKLQPEKFEWEEVEDEPWLVQHYGYDLTVPFKMFMPKHNPKKWRP